MKQFFLTTILLIIICNIVYLFLTDNKGKNSNINSVEFNLKCKLKNHSNDTLTLGELRNTLIFVFTPYSCRSCIERNIDQIKKIEEEYGEKIILTFICLFDTDRDLMVFGKTNGIKFPLYRPIDNLFNKDDLYTSYVPFFLSSENNEKTFTIKHHCLEETGATYDFLYNYFIESHLSIAIR